MAEMQQQMRAQSPIGESMEKHGIDYWTLWNVRQFHIHRSVQNANTRADG